MSESMAFKHEKKTGNLQAITGTSSTRLFFRDGSYLDFEANSTNPNPRTTGGTESDAHAFASDVKHFAVITGKLTFVFKDDSKMEFDISALTKK
jgi:hypothetical protein